MPKATVERAKIQNDFEYIQAHTIAIAYQSDLLSENLDLKCVECGDPETTMLQFPLTGDWSDKEIRDMWPARCSTKNDGECLEKQESSLQDFLEHMHTVYNEVVTDAMKEMLKSEK